MALRSEIVVIAEYATVSELQANGFFSVIDADKRRGISIGRFAVGVRRLRSIDAVRRLERVSRRCAHGFFCLAYLRLTRGRGRVYLPGSGEVRSRVVGVKCRARYTYGRGGYWDFQLRRAMCKLLALRFLAMRFLATRCAAPGA